MMISEKVQKAGEKRHFSLVNLEVTVVTSDMARQILEKNVYAGQRKLNKLHVKRQVQKMINRTWRENDIALATIRENKEPVLVNGQHQLNAIIESDIPQPMIIRHYRCGTKKGLAQLYAQFDNGDGDKPRSMQDIGRSIIEGYGLTDDDGDRIADMAIARFASAFSITNDGKWSSGTALTKDEKYKILLRSENFSIMKNIIHSIFKEQPREFTRSLDRSATIAAMIATWHVDPHDSYKFWTKVRDGSNLERNDPRKLLEIWVHAAKLVGIGRRGKNDHAVGVRELYSTCIHGWNAYRASDIEIKKFVKIKKFNVDETDPKPV